MFEELNKDEMDAQIADFLDDLADTENQLDFLLHEFDATTTPATPAEIREYLGFWAERAQPEQAVWRTLGFLDALVLV